MIHDQCPLPLYFSQVHGIYFDKKDSFHQAFGILSVSHFIVNMLAGMNEMHIKYHRIKSLYSMVTFNFKIGIFADDIVTMLLLLLLLMMMMVTVMINMMGGTTDKMMKIMMMWMGTTIMMTRTSDKDDDDGDDDDDVNHHQQR